MSSINFPHQPFIAGDVGYTAAGTIASTDVQAAILEASLGAELDYVEFTSNVACTATSAATANTVVTSTSRAWAGTEVIQIEFYACTWTNSNNTVTSTLDFWRDTTDIGVVWQMRAPTASIPMGAIYVVRRLTAAAGTYSFTVRGYEGAAGTFTVVAGAGGTATAMPGFIRITQVA